MNNASENEKLADEVQDAIFASIFDQVAIYDVIRDEAGNPVDFRLIRVNDAYVTVNHLVREEIIGRLYTDIWQNEKERGYFNLMVRVAKASVLHVPPRNRPIPNFNFFEGTASSVPGIYYQTFAFMPYPEKLVVIHKDMSDWYYLTLSLQEKESLLLQYREDLRRLTARLTLAEEKTRRSIATVLHDRFGYSMVSMLKTLREFYELPQEYGISARVDSVVNDMEKLIKDIRSFTFEVSPTLLYEVGVEAALETLCEDMFSKHNIKYSFTVAGKDFKPLSDDVKILLFHMVRELFVNIIKHSRADVVSVKFRRGLKKYQIIIEDNGVGFPARDNKDFRDLRGMGLFSIRERLNSLGGQISIVSEQDRGTIVSVIVPVDNETGVSAPTPERLFPVNKYEDQTETFIFDVKARRRAF